MRLSARAGDGAGRRTLRGSKAEAWRHRADNGRMIVFYWVMGVLIVGTFVPSVLYLVLYAVTGEDGCIRRARGLWNYSRLLTLFAGNILIWGHVIVGLWRIWFR
jgi:hypothetical protein